MRPIVVVPLLIAAAAAGYFAREFLNNQSDIRLPFPDSKSSSSLDDLGCEAITEGSAYENRLSRPTANAHAGRRTEKLALNLSADGKTLKLLYAFDVAHGATQPTRLNVHTKTQDYLVAEGQQTLGETAVILNVKTLKAVVSFTGQGMNGIKGSSYLVQCK